MVKMMGAGVMVAPHQLTLGALLKWRRDAMGLTQKQLAERSGVSVRTIIELEHDKSRPYHDTVHRLADELALPPRERLQFIAAAHHWDASPPDILAASWPRTLPVPPTPLLGRDAEVAAVMALLGREDVRLVTLLGTGGVGKTHLAIQVVALLAERFADVFFVPLAPVKEHHLLMATIARALGVRESGGQPLNESVAAHVGDRPVLLLLDNFEHVAEAAPSIAALLAACPRLKVLATSRRPLRLRGEHRFPVPSLAWPDPRRLPSLSDLKGYAAITLFAQRAQAVAPKFKLTPATARVIADICARVDGLPLAIELAAARVDVLSPQDLLAQLTRQPLQVLTDGAVDLPERQQAMRDTLAWSYNVLAPREQALFRRLAVFVGGCTIDAVKEACARTGEPNGDIPARLERLVDHSLLRQDLAPVDEATEPRFALLEIVRQYAEEQLVAAGEVELAHDRHRDWYLGLAEQAEPELTGPDQALWLARLEIEHDNLRAALRWTLERGNAAVGLRLAAALWWFWLIHGHLSEGRDWLKRLLENTESGDPERGATGDAREQRASRAKALRGAGGLAYEQGDYEDARGLYTAALALYQELDDLKGIAALLNNLGVIADTQAHYERATDLYQQSLSLKRELDDRWGMATSLGNLGRLALQQGQFDQAVTLYEESLALSRELGDMGSVALSLNNLGEVLLLQGEYERAVILLAESVALARKVDDKRGLAFALLNLGEVTFRQGDYERARPFYEESLRLRRELENAEGIAMSLSGLGDIARAQGNHGRAARLYLESLSLLQTSSDTALVVPILEQAAAMIGVACDPALSPDIVASIRATQLFGAAASLRDVLAAPLPPAAHVAHQRDVDVVRRALGDDVFARAWTEGRALSLEQAIATAIQTFRGNVIVDDA